MNYLEFAAKAFLFAPFSALVINNVLPKRLADKYFCHLSGAVALVQIISGVCAFLLMSSLGINRFAFSLFEGTAENEMLTLRPITLVFLFCVGMVSLVSVFVAARTVDAKKTSYVNLLMTLIIGMNGMLMVIDLFSLYVFLEVVGVSSFVMIAMFRSRKGLEGSIKYLIISEFATVFILTGLAFIFMKTGSLAYADIGNVLLDDFSQPQTKLVYISLILLISGFLIKAGAVPFHSWLPDAHQSADTSVSVLLSGIVIKVAGIYGIYVITDLFRDIEAIRISLEAIGLLSAAAGALLALRQTHFKRVAAYSSVSQTGFIILGLSAGTPLGIIGAAVHVFSHAAFKSTLFTNAAALHHQVGTLEIDGMGGLQKQMPITAASSVAAFLSTAGVPPFIGFWSKFLIVLALWTSGNEITAGIALCLSILSAAYMLRVQQKVFFGKTPENLKDVREITGSIRFTEILLTAVTGASGLLFPFFLLLLRSMGLI